MKTQKRSLVSAGLALLFPGALFSIALLMPLDERLESSAYIGLVDISATIPRSPVAQGEGQPRGVFLQVAVGRVVQTVKGAQRPGDDIEIDFDNGFMCPNVYYEADQRYLVFLEQGTNDRYSTVNYEAGRHRVANGLVNGLAVGAEGNIPIDDALAMLATMTKPK